MTEDERWEMKAALLARATLLRNVAANLQEKDRLPVLKRAEVCESAMGKVDEMNRMEAMEKS